MTPNHPINNFLRHLYMLRDAGHDQGWTISEINVAAHSVTITRGYGLPDLKLNFVGTDLGGNNERWNVSMPDVPNSDVSTVNNMLGLLSYTFASGQKVAAQPTSRHACDINDPIGKFINMMIDNELDVVKQLHPENTWTLRLHMLALDPVYSYVEYELKYNPTGKYWYMAIIYYRGKMSNRHDVIVRKPTDIMQHLFFTAQAVKVAASADPIEDLIDLWVCQKKAVRVDQTYTVDLGTLKFYIYAYQRQWMIRNALPSYDATPGIVVSDVATITAYIAMWGREDGERRARQKVLEKLGLS